jgi:hypothetical protein
MMVDRSVSVVIRFDDGRAEQRCSGPRSDGSCPLADETDGVGCVGGVIFALRGTVADGQRLNVGLRTKQSCPLALLVRIVPTPWD